MHFQGVDVKARELYVNIKRMAELGEGGRQVLSLGPEGKSNFATPNMPFGEIILSWLFLKNQKSQEEPFTLSLTHLPKGICKEKSAFSGSYHLGMI